MSWISVGLTSKRKATINDITLSNSTFTTGSPTATTVGSIAVQTTGPAFSGTLSLPDGTNVDPNPTQTGAAATLPTGWSLGGIGTLTTTIVKGTSSVPDGVSRTTTSIRINGTTGAAQTAFSILFAPTTMPLTAATRYTMNALLAVTSNVNPGTITGFFLDFDTYSAADAYQGTPPFDAGKDAIATPGGTLAKTIGITGVTNQISAPVTKGQHYLQIRTVINSPIDITILIAGVHIGTSANSCFQLSGSNLQTNGALADGTYPISIVATQSGAGGSPFSKSLSVSNGVVTAETANATSVTTAVPIVNASRTNGVASSGPFNTFQLVASVSLPPFQISINGAAATGGNVSQLYYLNHTLYQHASDGSTFDAWWYWDTTLATPGWTITTAPVLAINSVSLSDTTYNLNDITNTVVGTISVVMSDASAFSSANLSITGTNASSFNLNGFDLRANTTLSASSYNINIVAGGSASNAPFTQPFTLTALGAAVNYGTSASVFTAPLPLSSAGVAGQATSPMGWTVDFYDDFTGTKASTSTPNWPWGGFTTGAIYNGVLAKYGHSWSQWGDGGQADLSVDNPANITMSSSRLIFAGTNVGGVPNCCSCLLPFTTAWGYWEASIKCARGGNGNSGKYWNGFWLASTDEWPINGEFDIQESAWSAGIDSVIHLSATVNVDGPDGGLGRNIYSSSTLPGGVGWADGAFHTYGGLITPSYLAVFVDGILLTQTNSSTLLHNLQTVTTPSSSTPSSFGYNAANLNGELRGWDGTHHFVMWIGWYLNISGAGTFSLASLPAQMEVDWVRHSALFPATGGSHV